MCIREAVVDVATEGLKACSSSDVVTEACWLDTAQQILSVLVSQVQYKLIPPNLKTPGVWLSYLQLASIELSPDFTQLVGLLSFILTEFAEVASLALENNALVDVISTILGLEKQCSSVSSNVFVDVMCPLLDGVIAIAQAASSQAPSVNWDLP